MRRSGPGVRSQGGQIVVLALLVVVLLSVALILIATELALRLEAVRRERDLIRLTALTDAALAETLAQLAARPGFAGVEARPFSGGTITSRVEGVDEHHRAVYAEASYGERRRAVRTLVRLTTRGPVVLEWRRTRPEGLAPPGRRLAGP